MDWLVSKIRKNFWDFVLKGSGWSWGAFVVTSLYNGALSLTTMPFTSLVAFIFLNGFSYALLLCFGAYGLVKLIRFLIQTNRRWRDEKEDRLATKIANKINQAG